MKKLIALISTEKKSLEQIKKESQAAIKKYFEVSRKDSRSIKNHQKRCGISK